MKLQQLKSSVQMISSPSNTAAVVNPSSWRDGKNSSQRGYDYKWQQARDGFLAKHPLCVMCKEEGRVCPATVVDHKVAHRGDKTIFWDKTNWQSLCKTHHDSHAQRRDNASR